MKISKTTTYFALLLLAIFSFSCSPEDGETGPAGEDGNANVQTFTLDISTLTSFNIPFSELTQNVLDNDVVLTYVKRTDTSIGNTYFQVPGISIADMIEVELSLQNMKLFFYNRNSGNSFIPPVGRYESLKVIIIESSELDVAGRNIESNSIHDELENANVDISDYYAVCDYLGINY